MNPFFLIAAGALHALFYYFLRYPLCVLSLAIIVKAGLLMTGKQRLQPRYFLWSDIAIAFLAMSFWATCSLLPGVGAKSLSNLCEIMLLGKIWAFILAVRLVLSFLSVRHYVRCARLGNLLILLLCLLVAYLTPTMPE